MTVETCRLSKLWALVLFSTLTCPGTRCSTAPSSSVRAHVVAWLVQESERTGINIAWGWKVTHVAAWQGDVDKLRATSDEELGSLADEDDDNVVTVLHAAAMGDQAAVIEYLVRERGFDVHLRKLCRAALEVASMYGSLSAIEALVALGARLHDEPGLPSKALMAAAGFGQVAAMEKLVQLGADITAMGGHFGSVLHVAARVGQVETIECAVRLGADRRAVDDDGRTALHAAVESESLDVMRRIVELGVSLDGADLRGQTALHAARDWPQACRVLLELGADRWIKDNEGLTARDVAERQEYNRDRAEQVVQVLDSYFPIVPSMAQLLLGLKGRPSRR